MNVKTVGWFSAGVSSFVAIYLMKEEIDEVFYIDIDDQHPDTHRFLKDCEKALGMKINYLKHREFNSVEDVVRKYKFINSPYGAKCTGELKKKVRLDWEKEQHDVDYFRYVWGYDAKETNRAERLVSTSPEYEHVFPLIDKQLSKEEVHGVLLQLGIKRPVMYDLGYQNNNCIGCVKGGMGYWNKIRVDFPEVFKKRAELERFVGRSCIKGVFLDELDPNRGRADKEIMPDCGMMCEVSYLLSDKEEKQEILRKVKNISEATHVRFFGVSENCDEFTEDGKLYAIVDEVKYVDDVGDKLRITVWDYSPHVSYELLNLREDEK